MLSPLSPPSDSTPTPSCLLDRAAVAELYGISKRFLEISAMRGDGPPYIKLGRAVRYRPKDLDAWIDSQRIDPTAGGTPMI